MSLYYRLFHFYIDYQAEKKRTFTRTDVTSASSVFNFKQISPIANNDRHDFGLVFAAFSAKSFDSETINIKSILEAVIMKAEDRKLKLSGKNITATP